ncbi:hypothetical protein VPNG_03988 [Cytospora leucostoma]|uniref:J domain-containing protein n=1 Tax=Cytospora leucostoma TaxID=1230097 RepID=A0A423XDU8_9PEZI|nr:hypothetical protein VPNG_03988 [Cytospora leucostoma]
MSSDDLSVDLSNLSANLPNPPPNAPAPAPAPFKSTFSSTFSSNFQQSKFTSPGFTSKFTIDLGQPNFSSINLPSSGLNIPNVTSTNTTTTRAPKPENMEPTTEGRRPSGSAEPGPEPQQADADEGKPRGRATKFRFKSKEKKTPRSSSPDREPRRKHHRRQHRRSSSRPYRDDHRHDDFRDDDPEQRDVHDHHHRRHKRRRRGGEEQQQQQQARPGQHPDDGGDPSLDPETAFRESLFDAMADDEGAAYWEAIYGQPVHIYPRESAAVANPATGELERMTEDEYASYVRQRMWEKTHAGLLEERERRRAAREARAAEEEEQARIRREVERSLRKGEERRRRKGWAVRFGEYSAAWEAWDGGAGGIAWPTRSGERGDVGGEDGAEEVRRFFVRGLDLEGRGEREFAARLKEQRVRWHPDKMQQRLGGGEKVDEGVMRGVTAVFQVIDTLYDDIRSRIK